jgi:hypothetical protein
MRILILVSFAFALSIAAEKYGVYDMQGKRVSTFEAEWFDLPEKTRQVKGAYPQKNLYVSSFKKGKAFKPTSRYRYKAETGAYIEASRKETFAICPDKEIEGTWISKHSVYLNEANCLSLQAPNLAGTFRILFLQNSGKTDTIQVLVEQSYINMGDYSHRVWVHYDTIPEICKRQFDSCEESSYGYYESRKYEQALIVDKTEFTMGDAQHYSKFGMEINPLIDPNYKWGTISWAAYAYPSKEDLETSVRPYVDISAWEVANMRSKMEGLDTAYNYAQNKDGSFDEFTSNTNVSGYRLPSMEEWGMLMRAGASTRYYWGDEEDSLAVSRYTQVNPAGYTQHKVAQKQPNAFGLYDMISPNNTNTHSIVGVPIKLCGASTFVIQMPECRFLAGKVARQIKSSEPTHAIVSIQTGKREERYSYTVSFNATSTRLLRKTPKLHKLEKF